MPELILSPQGHATDYSGVTQPGAIDSVRGNTLETLKLLGGLPKISWAGAITSGKRGGEILAGIKTAREGDFRDGDIFLLAQSLCRAFKPAAVEEFHRPGVYKLATVFRKSRDAHAAMRGHFFECPRLGMVRAIGGEVA